VKIHMVKKGDTMYEIAKKHDIDLNVLIAANPQIADPNVLDVGMKVKIPNIPKPVTPPTEFLYKHTVVQGDSLWKIGKAWGIPLAAMIAANPQLKNPNILMTGEVVYVPKIKAEPAPAAAEQPPAAGEVPPMEAPLAPMPEAAEGPPAAELPQIPMEMPPMPSIEHAQEPPSIPVPVQDQGMPSEVPPLPQLPHQNLFEQFQVPATEVGGMNVEFSVMETNIWPLPEPPQFPEMPTDAGMMTPHYPMMPTDGGMMTPHYPMMPTYPAAGGDCGCGGKDPYFSTMPWVDPALTSYGPDMSAGMPHHGVQAMPLPGYTHGFEPHHHGFGYQGIMQPYHGGMTYPAGTLGMPTGVPYGFPYAPMEKEDCGCHGREKEAEDQGRSAEEASISGASKAAESAVPPKQKKRKKPETAKAAIRSLIARHKRQAEASARRSKRNKPWIG
jgi:morphogenetic protein associated with SpoVID